MTRAERYHKTLLFIQIACVINFYASPLLAADVTSDQNLEEQDKLLEDEITQEIEKTTAPIPLEEEKVTYKIGGWIDSIFRDYDDLDNNADTGDTIDHIWLNEVRLWGRINVGKKYAGYIRIKNTYVDRKITSDDYTGIGDDYEGPHLDVAYLKAVYPLGEEEFNLTFGRQYNYIGRGITYRSVHDGVKLAFETPHVFYKSFLTFTLPHENNVDSSQPQFDKEGERLFSGLELSYLGLPHSVAYAYYLYQKDFSESQFLSNAQTYQYDSQYIGLGLEGNVKSIGYAAEIIKEYGQSFTDAARSGGTSVEQDIDAWAADVNVNYTFDVVTHPLLEIEYGYGSGDKDRTSVTDSVGGNVAGDDDNFLYFGTYNAGYALTPRLSNLHVYQAHMAFSPLEKTKMGKKIRCGVKYYYYLKDEADGGISDAEATVSDKYVGQETDFYAYWDFSDRLSWSVRYGIFFPGDAYPASTNSASTYLYTRLTHRF